jgi:mono/diheme cytochrome c family protein
MWMKYGSLLCLVLLLGLVPRMSAQQSSPEKPLSDEQKLGQRIFQQRCSICHALPMVISKPYGPLLNKEIVQGREASVRTTIMEGVTGFMPGFRYGMEPSDVKAIIEYLKTVEKPAQPITNWAAEH